MTHPIADIVRLDTERQFWQLKLGSAVVDVVEPLVRQILRENPRIEPDRVVPLLVSAISLDTSVHSQLLRAFRWAVAERELRRTPTSTVEARCPTR